MGFWVYSSFSSASLALLHIVVLLLLHHKANATSECDLFTGKWVMDESYPLYNRGACPFLEHEFSCQKNGRPDQDYTKYKWQPLGCDLVRYFSYLFHSIQPVFFIKHRDISHIYVALLRNQTDLSWNGNTSL